MTENYILITKNKKSQQITCKNPLKFSILPASRVTGGNGRPAPRASRCGQQNVSTWDGYHLCWRRTPARAPYSRSWHPSAGRTSFQVPGGDSLKDVRTYYSLVPGWEGRTESPPRPSDSFSMGCVYVMRNYISITLTTEMSGFMGHWGWPTLTNILWGRPRKLTSLL